MPYVLLVHGGAGTIRRDAMSPEREAEHAAALAEALAAGGAVLARGGTALDAVEAAVRSMEDCPLFNAGRGAVYTAEGTHELDAAVMDGVTRRAGAVAGVTGVRHPVALARAVMERSGHVLLGGAGAEAFARREGLEFREPEWFGSALRKRQWEALKGTDRAALDHTRLIEDNAEPDGKYGTVGAVALDRSGGLAAATSTGGMTNKRFGRIGDSPVIGAGTWACDRCAVSCTGAGEFFLRAAAAHAVSARMRWGGQSLAEAAAAVTGEDVGGLGGHGGLIAVGADGSVALPFNTPGMYRGVLRDGEAARVAMYGDEAGMP
jgi:beta-aspartyl-peptidase (threonine type)